MVETLGLFAFGAGTFFIGIAVTAKAFFSLIGRHSRDAGEGCYGNGIAGVAIIIALYFFSLFVGSL
jgi:hypothetical protein